MNFLQLEALRFIIVILSSIISAMMVIRLIGAAKKYNLMDQPNERKNHAFATPLVGGVAIFLTFIICNWLANRQFPSGSSSLFIAALIILVVGVIDDLHEISCYLKFTVQTLAIMLLVSKSSVYITYFGNLLGTGGIMLDSWSFFLTVVAILGLVNAFNLIDGIDGLAGIQAFISLTFLAGIAYNLGNFNMCIEILILASAISGFLVFNLRFSWQPRAIVFLGDAGAMLLGLFSAWYSIKLAGSVFSAIKPITAVWINAYPILDMGGVILIRLFSLKNPLKADRRHMHHVLLDAGYSYRSVMKIILFFSLTFGLTGLLADFIGLPDFVMFSGFIVTMTLYTLVLWHPYFLRTLMNYKSI